MITAEYLGFFGSLFPSLLGILIVFCSLVFIALYVIVVTKVIAVLERTVLKKPEAVAKPKATKEVVKKDNKDAIKVAIIAGAIAQERRQPIDSFVITSIKKI